MLNIYPKLSCCLMTYFLLQDPSLYPNLILGWISHLYNFSKNPWLWLQLVLCCFLGNWGSVEVLYISAKLRYSVLSIGLCLSFAHTWLTDDQCVNYCYSSGWLYLQNNVCVLNCFLLIRLWLSLTSYHLFRSLCKYTVCLQFGVSLSPKPHNHLCQSLYMGPNEVYQRLVMLLQVVFCHHFSFFI